MRTNDIIHRDYENKRESANQKAPKSAKKRQERQFFFLLFFQFDFSQR